MLWELIGAFGEGTSLRQFCLDLDHDLREEDLRSICAAVRMNPALTTFHLGALQLPKLGVQELVKAIRGNAQLQNVGLCGLGLAEHHIVQMPLLMAGP